MRLDMGDNDKDDDEDSYEPAGDAFETDDENELGSYMDKSPLSEGGASHFASSTIEEVRHSTHAQQNARRSLDR